MNEQDLKRIANGFASSARGLKAVAEALKMLDKRITKLEQLTGQSVKNTNKTNHKGEK